MSRRAALEGLAQGLELALVNVRKLLSDPDPEEWVDPESSPLGRRRHNELARAGAFASARKVDGHWQVRRADIDAYIESQPAPARDEEAASEAAEIAEVLAYRSRRRKAG